MPTAQSLDEMIAEKAVEFADQVRKAAAVADTEEDVRIAVSTQIAFILKETGITLQAKHEFAVARGRVDSVYPAVLLEFKNPNSPARIGPKADSPGSKKVVEQIKQRFHGMRDEHNQPFHSLLGVGLDGNHFIFVRYRDENWEVQGPFEVNRHSAERFLWALFNLGQKGKPFSPEYLAGDFGASEGSIALSGVHTLYEAVVATDNPKAQVFFNQWKILFGEVCGYDVDNPSHTIKKLAETSRMHSGLREWNPPPTIPVLLLHDRRGHLDTTVVHSLITRAVKPARLASIGRHNWRCGLHGTASAELWRSATRPEDGRSRVAGHRQQASEQLIPVERAVLPPAN